VFKDTDPDYDANIITKLNTQPVMEYLIRVGIEGLKRVLTNQKYTSSATADKAKKEFDRDNHPVISYLEENGIEGIENENTDDVLLRFNVWARVNGYKEIGKTKFTQELKKCGFDTKTITQPNRKSYKIYILKE
jgi:putative DNA primase/helicase